MPKRMLRNSSAGGVGLPSMKRYDLEEHTLWSAWVGGSVCTTCFIVVFVCGLFTMQVGEFVLLCLAVFVRVCTRKSQSEVDY